jgi:hypothetical protein
MSWSEAADSMLLALMRMVPETLRELAGASARGESEAAAEQRGASEVEVDDVVRGWIRTTPPEQRNGLVAVLESLGLEPERYADELESAEGWDEEFEEPPDSEL